MNLNSNQYTKGGGKKVETSFLTDYKSTEAQAWAQSGYSLKALLFRNQVTNTKVVSNSNKEWFE